MMPVLGVIGYSLKSGYHLSYPLVDPANILVMPLQADREPMDLGENAQRQLKSHYEGVLTGRHKQ